MAKTPTPAPTGKTAVAKTTVATATPTVAENAVATTAVEAAPKQSEEERLEEVISRAIATGDGHDPDGFYMGLPRWKSYTFNARRFIAATRAMEEFKKHG